MLTLTGIVRAALTIPAKTNAKTGEVFPARSVLQLEGEDERGLVQLYTLTVPDLADFAGKVGQEIRVPVRAWAKGATVNLSFGAAA